LNQPVADDVVVDAVLVRDNHVKQIAAIFIWTLEFFSSIKTWKPNHSAMLSDYKKTQEPDHEKGNQVVITDLHTPNDKPVFTQAMADAGEWPPVGCECEYHFKSNTADEWIKVTVDYISKMYFIFTRQDGEQYHQYTEHMEFRISDTRTDEEKLRDVLRSTFNADWIVDALINNNKFTITLNKVGE